MRRLLSILVSLAILALIYWRIDFAAMLRAFYEGSAVWLVASLAMVVPLTMLTAYRLVRMLPAGSTFGFRESLSLTLAGSAMNMVLPSKMGDVAKSWFLVSRGYFAGGAAVSLVVFEKGFDMLALLLWCAFGLFVLSTSSPLFWPLTAAISIGTVAGLAVLGSPTVANRVFTLLGRRGPGTVRRKVEALADGWMTVQRALLGDHRRLAYVAALSIVIWFLHLLQIWMFILALGAWAPFAANLGLAPLAILAGLLPLTFAGVGTRDAALIVLYQPWLAAPTAAALGILCTMRYVLPALGGLPALQRYLTEMRSARPAAG